MNNLIGDGIPKLTQEQLYGITNEYLHITIKIMVEYLNLILQEKGLILLLAHMIVKNGGQLIVQIELVILV